MCITFCGKVTNRLNIIASYVQLFELLTNSDGITLHQGTKAMGV